MIKVVCLESGDFSTMIKNENNIPVGYKDSTVGVIPQEWEVKKVKSICNIDANSLSSKTSPDYEFDYISLSDVDNDSFEVIKSHQLFKTAPSRARRIVKRNDVVISTVRPNLQGFFMIKNDVEDLIVSTGFSVLSPIKCNPYYLLAYFFSEAITKQFYSLVVGSNYPAVNSSDIANLKIACPTLIEQQKIVEILRTWDEAIEKQTKLIKALEKRKQALMQRLLSGRTRLPGFTGEWTQKTLKELFSERIETNCMHLPLLSITAEKGVILQSESDKKDNSNEDKSKYKRICPNDIGYNTMRMWQGRSALSQIEGIVSPAYTIVTPNADVCPLFMAELLKRPRVVYDFWAHSQGLVSDTLNCKFPDFAQVKVNVPPLEEQIAIANILVSADDEIKRHNTKLSQLRKQKQGLMQQLLTGKRRVK